MSKVLRECQGKDETPTEWLERLRKGLRMYSRMNPDSLVGMVLLKTQFVAKSWEDIWKKIEKMDGWQELGLQELLQEAQKVYMRRDEEKQKIQAKVLVAGVREAQKQEQRKDTAKKVSAKRPSPAQGRGLGEQKWDFECFYCKQKGHIKRNCPNRAKDQAIFQED